MSLFVEESLFQGFIEDPWILIPLFGLLEGLVPGTEGLFLSIPFGLELDVFWVVGCVVVFEGAFTGGEENVACFVGEEVFSCLPSLMSLLSLMDTADFK